MNYNRRRNKYGVAIDAKGIEDRTMDGIVFDSLKEKIRYSELMLLYRSKIIKDLVIHKKHPLVVNGIHICEWESDFEYVDQSGQLRIEDVKVSATATSLYKVKKKLFEALNPTLRIVEI